MMIKSDRYELYKGDCLEAMDGLIEKGVKVDMVLCDPPYGTTACKWDSVIPFDEMWSRLDKLIKDNSAVVLFSSQPFTSALVSSNYKLFKYEWIWQKSRTVGFLNAKNAPLKRHEVICVFSKGNIANGSKKNMTYYPQGLTEVNKVKKSARGKVGSIVNPTPSRRGSYLSKYTGYPNSILIFNNEGKTVHPTQKPVALMEYLIKTYTLEGETVLDFTMGSGSTGVACMNTNRKFIGIELDEGFFNISKERIEGAADQSCRN